MRGAVQDRTSQKIRDGAPTDKANKIQRNKVIPNSNFFKLQEERLFVYCTHWSANAI